MSTVMGELDLQVTGMTCEHCERAVAAELSTLAAVEDLEVDAATGIVRITHSTPLVRGEVERAIADAGYELAGWPSGDHA
ncbi:heavy-metal-associated domain-containing protein [Mycolicibacterium sp.]|uniref:heavy-metal-associated domain-containing protein n=1 Tax=Mycolicibacterium sp. TaxID=2320850 RepID=UPI003D0A4885